jgi:hypothetical protein
MQIKIVQCLEERGQRMVSCTYEDREIPPFLFTPFQMEEDSESQKLGMIKYMVLEGGLDPNYVHAWQHPMFNDFEFLTVLILAVNNGYLNMVQFLIEEAGADPDSKCPFIR